MLIYQLMTKIEKKIKKFILKQGRNRRLVSYLKSDRRPWRKGYSEYRQQYLSNVINNDHLMQVFRKNKTLPDGYGFRLDARVIEIPWVLARLEHRKGRFLDAGSSLNHKFVLKAPALSNKKVTITTLAPEAQCHWRLGVSYLFGDLRNLDFRNDRFDMITCISTIEHIGMDNSMYTDNVDVALPGDTKEFILAVRELKRVLRPGGVLFITFPFGRYENHGWFQQFDSKLTDALIECFDPASFNEKIFQYAPDGWKISDRVSCADCQFFDVHKSKYFDPNSTTEYPADYPAGERAVACLELFKREK